MAALPLEITDHIAQQMRPADLPPLLLVSRMFYYATIPLVFRRITFRAYRDVDDSHVVLLFEILSANPDLLKSIQMAEILSFDVGGLPKHCDRADSDVERARVSRAVTGVLELLCGSNLQSLTVSGGLCRVLPSDGSLEALLRLRRIPTLKTLTLYDLDAPYSLWAGDPATDRLQHLGLNWCRLRVDAELLPLPSESATNDGSDSPITPGTPASLAVDSKGPTTRPAPLSRLKELRFEAASGVCTSEADGDVKFPFPGPLLTFPSVQSLVIPFIQSPSTNDEETADVLCSTPAIETLTLWRTERSLRDWMELDTPILDLSKLGQLRHLILHDYSEVFFFRKAILDVFTSTISTAPFLPNLEAVSVIFEWDSAHATNQTVVSLLGVEQNLGRWKIWLDVLARRFPTLRVFNVEARLLPFREGWAEYEHESPERMRETMEELEPVLRREVRGKIDIRCRFVRQPGEG